MNPVLKRLDKSKQKELEAQIQKQFDPVEVCISQFNLISWNMYTLLYIINVFLNTNYVVLNYERIDKFINNC